MMVIVAAWLHSCAEQPLADGLLAFFVAWPARSHQVKAVLMSTGAVQACDVPSALHAVCGQGLACMLLTAQKSKCRSTFLLCAELHTSLPCCAQKQGFSRSAACAVQPVRRQIAPRAAPGAAHRCRSSCPVLLRYTCVSTGLPDRAVACAQSCLQQVRCNF